MDLLASLVAAQKGKALSDQAALLEHISSCSAPRPCAANPLCDAAKSCLEHYRQCDAPTCDNCAQARLVEAEGGNEFLENLLSRRAELRDAKSEIQLLSQSRSTMSLEQFKSENSAKRAAWTKATAALNALCGEIHHRWRSSKSGGENASKADASIAQTPPKEMASSPSRSNKLNVRSSPPPSPAPRDVLTSLIKAKTRLASREDKALLQHVMNCSAPRPCRQEPFCDEGKERMEHFKRCTVSACTSCSLPRLIEASDAGKPVAHLQMPLLKAKRDWERAFETSKTRVNAYFATRHELGVDPAVVSESRNAMSEAKKAQEGARKEYERLCESVFAEWTDCKKFTKSISNVQHPPDEGKGEIVMETSPVHEETVSKTRDAEVTSRTTTEPAKAMFEILNGSATSATLAKNSVDVHGDGIAPSEDVSAAEGVVIRSISPHTRELALAVLSRAGNSLPAVNEAVVEAFVRVELAHGSEADAALLEHVAACSVMEQPGHRCAEAQSNLVHFKSCVTPACTICARTRALLLAARLPETSALVSALARAQAAHDSAVAALRNMLSSETMLQPLSALTDNILKAQGAHEFMAGEIYARWRTLDARGSTHAAASVGSPALNAVSPSQMTGSGAEMLPPSPLNKVSSFPSQQRNQAFLGLVRPPSKRTHSDFHDPALGSHTQTEVKRDSGVSGKRARHTTREDDIWTFSPRAAEGELATIIGPSPYPSVATEPLAGSSLSGRQSAGVPRAEQHDRLRSMSGLSEAASSGDESARLTHRLGSGLSDTGSDEAVRLGAPAFRVGSGFSETAADFRTASALSTELDTGLRTASGMSELLRIGDSWAAAEDTASPRPDKEASSAASTVQRDWDMCAQLIAAKAGLRASPTVASLMHHISECTSRGPCSIDAQCDRAKTSLEHFKQCLVRTCDPCAHARLLESQCEDEEDRFTALTKARMEEKAASAAVLGAKGMPSDIVAAARTKHRKMKARLQAVCGDIHDIWAKRMKGST